MGRLVRALAAAAVLVALAGCGARPAGGEGFVAGDGTITVIPAAERRPAPPIEGTTLDDAPWSSAGTAGTIVVYNVWGSWCAPCRKEAPALEEAALKTAGRAVFVGLNTRDIDPVPARAFVRAFHVTYPSLYDPDGRLLLRFGGQLPPSAIPSTLIVDAQGRVAARVIGEVTAATLVGLVDDLAGEAR